MARPRNVPAQYRLDLYDQRHAKDRIMVIETLERHGDHAVPTLVPSGEEIHLGADRVRVTFHFPQNLQRVELDEVCRWIGRMAGREVDHIFDEWEAQRLHRAGVPLRLMRGTADQYRLDDLALCGPAAQKPQDAPEPTAPALPELGEATWSQGETPESRARRGCASIAAFRSHGRRRSPGRGVGRPNAFPAAAPS